MLNRFKSAVSTVVTGISHLERSGGEAEPEAPEGPLKFPYGRPEFLQLNVDEVQVSADHVSRPILVPRDISRLPWSAGYAEVINAGKSKCNEDQARAETLYVRRMPSRRDSMPGRAIPRSPAPDEPVANGTPPQMGQPPSAQGSPPCVVSSPSSPLTFSCFEEVADDPLPFTYFAIFDGHAGSGAAVAAANLLHLIILEKLSQVRDLIISHRYGLGDPSQAPEGTASSERLNPMDTSVPLSRSFTMDKTDDIPLDDLVIGALESAFFKMDKVIYEEKRHFVISGGCTALVALFFLGKLYVANAGDSRAIIARGEDIIPMSRDFTPDSERERLRLLGFLCPDLLQNEFTHLEFSRRIFRHDIGKKVLCRNARMKGWTLKTVTPEDIRYPLIAGEGKKARLLATIGVTRGFGDHDLTVGSSSIHIKPFLTPAPEVKVYDLQHRAHADDDVLIMGSDGLWDVTSNERAATIVRSALHQFSPSEKARYTSAAQELVMNARGLLRKGWRTLDDRMASGDDITAFVVPLHPYSQTPPTESLPSESPPPDTPPSESQPSETPPPETASPEAP